MTATLRRTDDGGLILTVTIPWEKVQSEYTATLSSHVKRAEVAGFRKGKAPKKLVEDRVDKSHLYEDVLKTLVPAAYNEALLQLKLRPVVTPKVEIVSAKEGEDWTLSIHTCEKPTITLGDYRHALVEAKQSQGKKIWVPGKEDKSDETQKSTRQPLEAIIAALQTSVTVRLPQILVEQEVNRMLSDLIDQTKKLGLSVEQYLASTGRTIESLRHEYDQQAKRTLLLEFALEAIADKEDIITSDEDIDKVIQAAKTEEEKKQLAGQRYYVAAILRKQKTLDFLAAV